MSAWIKCSERLPLNGRSVIVCAHNRVVLSQTLFWAFGDWWVTGQEHSGPLERWVITHWMEMPGLPEEE